MSDVQAGADDFQFQDADPGKAKTLSPEQVRFFNDYGYLNGIAIGGPDEATARREYLDQLYERMEGEDDGRDAYSLLGYQTRCAGLWDLVHDPRILDVIEDLIGGDILCWSTHYLNKLPGDRKRIHLHQDASYWPFSPRGTVTAWMAIDRSNLDNGCMHVAPGSHRQGQIQWKEAGEPHPLEGTKEAFYQKISDPEALGELVPLVLEPGQISLHSDLTVHGSFPNLSENRRAGFAIRYCAPSVRPTDPTWGKNAILCRGEDRSGHFERVEERPEGEDVSSWPVYMMRQRAAAKRRSRSPE